MGAVSDGLFGAVAFDFISPHDFVEAKKSWFFFDREYVCLGAGINCKRDLPVVTTVNQVLMRSDVAVCRDGKVETLKEGKRVLDQVQWVYQDRVGYIFPKPATVNLSNRKQTGRWSDITDQKNISEALVSEDVFALWFDHGHHPSGASYEYIVVPNVTRQALNEASESKRGIKILANTADLQAVKHSELGISQMAFFKPGVIEVAEGIEVEISSHGMVMAKLEQDRIRELSVADPSRTLNSITVSLSGIYDSQGKGFATTPNRNKNRTAVTIDLPQGVYAGKSVTIRL